VNDVVAAYGWLLAEVIKPEHIVFADSAGGEQRVANG
jgi:acetyl esterase/lipase